MRTIGLRAAIAAHCGVLLAWAAPCQAGEVTRRPFGVLPGGQAVEAIDLAGGATAVTILTLGAAIQSITTADRDGHRDDVVLGYDDLAGYIARPNFFGMTLGRVANRIGHARFTLDGTVFRLAGDVAGNTLHGGPRGFDKAVWNVVATSTSGRPASVTLQLVSPDGDNGFPGTLTTRVTYAVDNRGMLSVRYQATTDKPTVVSLSNHTYWNLAGSRAGRPATGMLLTIPASHITTLGPDHLPTGAFYSVAGTPFDFRRPARIDARAGSADAQLALGRGYDHNWVIGRAASSRPRLAARLEDPVSGRIMAMRATMPGVQMFAGGSYNGIVGKGAVPYARGQGVALEPQMFPDAQNHPNFPSIVLRPGQTYRARIEYRFSTGGRTADRP
ncbi:aldose epimerase family protein [Novosphingobium resinovorum]|uniref:aldose epimerase family protein n=1 Tax=Novosphingobium resinovorum TaxID=158500 RepID=UPI002ED1E226|nr:aldose epimerase family protein [Novosphingobium resinovorum]